jgi:Sec-independent protein secretion pathway component TatC
LIYTNPAEVFYIYFSLVLYFSLLLIIPFFIWHMVDFLRSSLYKNEFYTLNRYLKGMFCSVCLVNTFSILIIFP